MKKSVFIAVALFTFSLAPKYVVANDNVDIPSVQEICENFANEDTSDNEWNDVFDDCVAEHDQIVEDSSWETTPSDDGYIDEDVSESDDLDQ